MRRTQFSEGEYYHIFNRGVDKRTIFLNTRDYERFLYLLFACNDRKPLLNSQFHYRGFASIETYPRERDLLVDILCFCLMPNHFHLMLHERTENGISRFMQKLGTGYTMYFNKRYERSGALLQGVFKSVHVDRQAYILHLSSYIHLNPAGIPSRESEDIPMGIVHGKRYEYAKHYPWSSYAAYLGTNRYDPLLNKQIIHELLCPKPQEYERHVHEWLMRDAIDSEIEPYLLE